MEKSEIVAIVERLRRNEILSSLKSKALRQAIENEQWRDIVEYGLLLCIPYCEDREIRNEAKGVKE